MIPTKVIHVLPHSPSPNAHKSIKEANLPKKENYIEIDYHPFWIGFFEEDFHVLLAKETIQQSNDYEVECWRTYDVARVPYFKKINGITHRLFPSTNKKIGRLNLGERSSQLITNLKKEVDGGNLIVHLHALHSPTINHIISCIDFSKTPVIISQRGGGSPYYLMRRKFNPLHIINFFKEKVIYKQIDHFLVMSKPEYDLLCRTYGETNVSFFQDGIDFDLFKNSGRQEAREKLGVAPSSLVLLYVGRFYRWKGLHHILRAFKRLHNKNPKTALFLLGGYEDDELFPFLVSEGINVVTRLRREKIVDYYTASDILLFPSTEWRIKNFAGISNACIESLACGTPIYTSQMRHFMGSEEEKELIGMEFTNNSSIEADLYKMLEYKGKYTKCKEIAMKYYSRKSNVSKLIEIYKRIRGLYL